jgi:hypothetical protein
MSQSQELIVNQEFAGGGGTGNGTTSFSTGQNCPKSGLYKSTDGKVELIEYIPVNTAFPPFGGGNGTKKCLWTRLSLASDGSKTSFTAVKVAAGSI